LKNKFGGYRTCKPTPRKVITNAPNIVLCGKILKRVVSFKNPLGFFHLSRLLFRGAWLIIFAR